MRQAATHAESSAEVSPAKATHVTAEPAAYPGVAASATTAGIGSLDAKPPLKATIDDRTMTSLRSCALVVGIPHSTFRSPLS